MQWTPAGGWERCGGWGADPPDPVANPALSSQSWPPGHAHHSTPLCKGGVSSSTRLRSLPSARDSDPQWAERAPPSSGRRHSPQRWPSGRQARWREAGQTCYCRTYTGSTDKARVGSGKESGCRPGQRTWERWVPARPTGRALKRVRAQASPRPLVQLRALIEGLLVFSLPRLFWLRRHYV